MAALRFADKVALIREVKNHPVLWDGEHEKYGDRFSTAAAWKTIARKLKISENIIKAKWKNLRDTYRTIVKKSGISYLEEYDGKWRYFHLMAFIKEREYKDDVEFIVESDSGDESSDDESQVSYSAHSNNNHDSKSLTQNSTTDEETSKSNCNNRLKYEKNESKSENDEDIIRYIDRREYDDHTYDRKPEEMSDTMDSNSNNDDIPFKRQKTSDTHANYDVMFLKSLGPYFKQLDPLRKLVMRSRIQGLLLNEIAEQKSLNFDS